MKPPKIAVVGSLNTDMAVKVPYIPRGGETLLGGDFRTSPGGKGANQAVAAARAGGHVSFVGRVGRDAFGEAAIQSFLREGIDAEFVLRDPECPSGVALIFVGPDGENSIAVAPGANDRLAPDDIVRARDRMADAAVLLLQLETPADGSLAAAEYCRARGASVVLNPAPARALPDAIWPHLSIVTPNESEAELLTGVAVKSDAGAAEAARRLRARGVPAAIITLGARGAWVSTAHGDRLVPGFAVRVVDTTGAGDVFNGALAVALAEGRELLAAVRFANAAAALSVTKYGTQTSAPTRAEIDRLERSS